MSIKYIALAAMTLASASTFADTIKGNSGRYCTGAELTINPESDSSYIERVVVEAEGIGSDGFIEAYADGVRVARLGVPGYDPLYTFRVRRNVSEIKLDFKAEKGVKKCFNIISFTAYTPVSIFPTDYDRYEADKVRNGTWGGETLALIKSLNRSMVDKNLMVDSLFRNVLKPLRNISLLESASESERQRKSLIRIQRALGMAKIITENQDVLFSRIDNGVDDHIVMDLLSIKEDILEHVDVKEGDIEEALKYVTKRIEE
jgi:hypothetical protein